jgi:ATP-dependent Clp protease ATP-binding subunit ClpB
LKQHHITLTWTDEVMERIKVNYDTQYGVRSIQHEVERSIVNPIARAHEMDEIGERSQIHVYCDKGVIQLRTTKSKDIPKKSPLSFLRSS